jgi:dTDP-4-dehydrorhamnose reductase
MRLLITGAAGMLGRDLHALACEQGHECVALPRSALDVSDPLAVDSAVNEAAARGAGRLDAVINCAAYTDVDGAQSDPRSAFAINGEGPGHLARAAARAGAWMLHVSSDYVFDGRKRSPYLESDRTGPLSVYGQSKLAGELAVASAAPDGHTIVRSSWLFGLNGACFPATILRLAGEREELAVVEDQVGCPTYTVHLAEGLLELIAGAGDPPCGVVHMSAARECSWFTFAAEILRRAGAATTVRPCRSDQMPRPAPRPAYSVLRSERGEAIPELPSWREGLEEYLGARTVRA